MALELLSIDLTYLSIISNGKFARTCSWIVPWLILLLQIKRAKIVQHSW